MDSFIKNYTKIYFWKIISTITGFLSLFIVIPHLSQNKNSYSFKKIAKLIANKYKNCKLEFIKIDGKYTIRKFNNLRIYKLLNVKNEFNIKKEINKFVHRK